MNRPIMSALAVGLLLNVAAAAQRTAPQAREKPAAGAPLEDSWYKATRVADKVWRIDDHGNDNLYLIEGTRQALLVDTGLGLGKLGDFVKALTALPVVVINTHGHTDHSGGNNFFPSVYAHAADFDAIRAITRPEARRKAAERATTNAPAPGLLSADEAGRLPAATLLPLKDGQVFDLGGRTLEVIEQSGHTPGEIVLLDKANGLLVAGDNNNTLVWLFLGNSRPLEVYLASLRTLKQRAGDAKTILPGHGGPLPISHLDDQIACVEDILAGRCTAEPYQQGAAVGARVCAHGPASVAFDPKNLRGGV